MAADMTDTPAQAESPGSVDAVLQDELVHADTLTGTIAPILRHLLANNDHSVFGDAVIARVRGMLNDLAGQLFDALAFASGEPDPVDREGAAVAELVECLVENSALVGHCHALALEWQLTERMQARLGLDPVLSPLLQALIASSEAHTSGIAMALLASQARFAQQQRRMALPLAELPGDYLHGALLAFRAVAANGPELTTAEAAIRGKHDEARSRLGLIARIITGMGGGAAAALSVSHAGVAMFLSALAIGSGQDRDMAVIATNEGQLARLALSLRSAGLKTQAVEEAFLSLHPDIALPEGFDALGADRAAALLANSAAYPRL
jgi:hypothetical protein